MHEEKMYGEKCRNFDAILAGFKKKQIRGENPPCPKKVYALRPEASGGVSKETREEEESVSREGTAFIDRVHRVLSFLDKIKEELFREFKSDNEIMKGLASAFRDIEPLKSTYSIILESIKHVESKVLKKSYLYDVFLDPIVSNHLKLYKPFLSQYLDNAKWIGDFYRNNERCRLICENINKNSGVTEDIISGLYTVFNSLFCLELMFNRYRTCFSVSSEPFKKANETMAMLSKILEDVNRSHSQEDFLIALNELNHLKDINIETKINVRFIYKGCATKFARRNDKTLRRQLVLFSDCLYVSSLPGIIRGTSTVKQELSVNNMKVSEIHNEDALCLPSLVWGLSIKCPEVVQDFFFDSEEIMNIWKEKFLLVIKEDNKDATCSYVKTHDDFTTLGLESPRWQKDSAASICNGYLCDLKFSPIIRRHHCRADGLLYCDVCSSFKLKLKFDPSVESRVCELCYNILHVSLTDPELYETSLKQLKEVQERKTRSGKKVGWLSVKLFDNEKSIPSLDLKYYCELKNKSPILNFYCQPEDKCQCRRLSLVDMSVSEYPCCNYTRNLSSNEFILFSLTNDELYLVKAVDEGDCQRWIESLEETIKYYLQNTIPPESEEDFESDKDD